MSGSNDPNRPDYPEFPITVRRIEPVNSRQNSPARYSQDSGKNPRMSRSIRLAVYLYKIAFSKVSSQQREYVANLQAKMNLAEIQKAYGFLHTLSTDPRTRARIQVNRLEVPASRPRPTKREQRRIGVGYRDKGSLRSSHRPVLPAEVTLGHEAVALTWDTLPRWILDGERKSQTEVLSDWRRNASEAGLHYPDNHLLASDAQWERMVALATFPPTLNKNSDVETVSE